MSDGRASGSRRAMFAVVLLMAVAGCGASKSSKDLYPAPRVDDRPNVIVFMTDDQTVEQMRFLSNVEELIGQRGVTFSNMNVNYSNCCPSRATFLTGQEARNHGLMWNVPPTGGYAQFRGEDTTLPVALQKSGYQTIMIGKYLNRFGEFEDDLRVPPGWDDFQALVWPAESIYYGNAFFDNGSVEEMSSRRYYADEMTERTVESIKRAKLTGRPFFAWINYVAPHGVGGVTLDEYKKDKNSVLRLGEDDEAPVPEPRFRGALADLALPETPAFNEVDISDKASINQRVLLTDSRLEDLRERYVLAAEALLSVDASVATIIEYLASSNQLDNTYLIFTSDNGQFFGEHRFDRGKYLPYDPSRSVPLIVSGPGVAEGAISDQLASNVDLAPTIAEIAEVSLPRVSDGISLMRALSNPRVSEVDRVILLEGHAPEDRIILPFWGILSPEYLYVRYSDGEAEYYDLLNDPFELRNIVSLNPLDPRVTVAENLLDSILQDG